MRSTELAARYPYLSKIVEAVTAVLGDYVVVDSQTLQAIFKRRNNPPDVQKTVDEACDRLTRRDTASAVIQRYAKARLGGRILPDKRMVDAENRLSPHGVMELNNKPFFVPIKVGNSGGTLETGANDADSIIFDELMKGRYKGANVWHYGFSAIDTYVSDSRGNLSITVCNRVLLTMAENLSVVQNISRKTLTIIAQHSHHLSDEAFKVLSDIITDISVLDDEDAQDIFLTRRVNELTAMQLGEINPSVLDNKTLNIVLVEQAKNIPIDRLSLYLQETQRVSKGALNALITARLEHISSIVIDDEIFSEWVTRWADRLDAPALKGLSAVSVSARLNDRAADHLFDIMFPGKSMLEKDYFQGFDGECFKGQEVVRLFVWYTVLRLDDDRDLWLCDMIDKEEDPELYQVVKQVVPKLDAILNPALDQAGLTLYPKMYDHAISEYLQSLQPDDLYKISDDMLDKLMSMAAYTHKRTNGNGKEPRHQDCENQSHPQTQAYSLPASCLPVLVDHLERYVSGRFNPEHSEWYSVCVEILTQRAHHLTDHSVLYALLVLANKIDNQVAVKGLVEELIRRLDTSSLSIDELDTGFLSTLVKQSHRLSAATLCALAKRGNQLDLDGLLALSKRADVIDGLGLRSIIASAIGKVRGKNAMQDSEGMIAPIATSDQETTLHSILSNIAKAYALPVSENTPSWNPVKWRGSIEDLSKLVDRLPDVVANPSGACFAIQAKHIEIKNALKSIIRHVHDSEAIDERSVRATQHIFNFCLTHAIEYLKENGSKRYLKILQEGIDSCRQQSSCSNYPSS